MKHFDELKIACSHKTEITREEYEAAQNTMAEEDFKRRYLCKTEIDSYTNVETKSYYSLDYDPEDAKLLLLEEIRKNTESSSRYVRYIWYYIVTMLILSGAVALLYVMANS